MGRLILISFISLSILLLLHRAKPATSLPLSTSSRWIIDNQTKQRVKLACVNWVSHLEPVVAEGLSKQPMDTISKKILSMGFNCVRLTWPLFLATNDSLASLTVRQSFQNLGLVESIAGIKANNPSIIDLTLIQAFQAVVTSLGDNNVMVILDNHISKPGWCCSNFDDNGFFGDKYFNPDTWLQGLTKIATIFTNNPNVVAMSLRNELRGPKQNVSVWYKYMQKGAEAVHSANPNLLVILSGLRFDADLSFLKNQEVKLSFKGKLVFEMHWYSFTDGGAWGTGNVNEVCGRVVKRVAGATAFLVKKEFDFPLFVSEFGLDERGSDVGGNRWLNCFMGVAAELDLDWALWTLVGSYYLREGVIGLNEFYGVLDWNWCGVRNSSLLKKISVLQSPFQGPGLAETQLHKLIFHPATGLCVVRKSLFGPLRLGTCSESEAWSYTTQKTLLIKGSYFCIQAEKSEMPAKIGLICSDSSSKWEMISDPNMHLSSKLSNGTTVCLDVDESNTVVTRKCKCLSKDNMCDPTSQWFKLVDSTRSSTSTKSVSVSDFTRTGLLGSLLQWI